jgi:predicted Zn-dependent peptidase
MPGPTYADPNRTRLELLNTILGGSFTSRLNHNLREERGYTYGARSSYAMNPSAGYFAASSSVRADVTGDAVAQFLKEFAGIRGGDISDGEAKKARASRRMDMIQAFSGLRGILDAGTTLVRNGRPFTELGEELQAVARSTATELNRLANDAVPLERGLLVLVGDEDVIRSQLDTRELPEPIELTITGDPK